MAPKNIFICYRRDDAAGYARSIYDRLNARFPNRVFMDVEGIVPGSDYSQVIQNTVGTCHALLAIIGKSWAPMVDGSNQRRIDLADDYVRHEIGTALRRNIPVIPVLVRKAEMPSTQMLPPDLAALSLREAIEITDGDFNHDCERLIAAIERQFGEVRHQPPPVTNTGGKNSCLIFGLIGALGVGAVGVVLFVLLWAMAPTPSPVVQTTSEPVDSQPAPTTNPTQAPTTKTANSGNEMTADSFTPQGDWVLTSEINSVETNLRVLVYGNGFYQSDMNSGEWGYDRSQRRLTLYGWIDITIEDYVDGEFVGEGKTGYARFPIKMRRN